MEYFNVLVAEDRPKTRQLLTELLEDQILHCRVTSVGSVEEGEKVIDEMYRHRRSFHGAVLDVELPKSTAPGSPYILDFSLCNLLKNKNSIAIHVTAHDSHPDVIQHMKDCHTSYFASIPAMVVKTGDWDEEVVRLLRAFLYDQKILRGLEGIFGHEMGEPSGVAAMHAKTGSYYRSPGAYSGALSYDLMELRDDISEFWEFTSDEVKKHLQKSFYVDTSKKPVEVRLFAQQ